MGEIKPAFSILNVFSPHFYDLKTVYDSFRACVPILFKHDPSPENTKKLQDFLTLIAQTENVPFYKPKEPQDRDVLDRCALLTQLSKMAQDFITPLNTVRQKSKPEEQENIKPQIAHFYEAIQICRDYVNIRSLFSLVASKSPAP